MHFGRWNSDLKCSEGGASVRPEALCNGMRLVLLLFSVLRINGKDPSVNVWQSRPLAFHHVQQCKTIGSFQLMTTITNPLYCN